MHLDLMLRGCQCQIHMRVITVQHMQISALKEAHAGCGAAAAAAAREAEVLRQKAAQLAADRLQAAANLRRAENEARAKQSGVICLLLSWRPCSTYSAPVLGA